jgi:hypothetical protein
VDYQSAAGKGLPAQPDLALLLIAKSYQSVAGPNEKSEVGVPQPRSCFGSSESLILFVE